MIDLDEYANRAIATPVAPPPDMKRLTALARRYTRRRRAVRTGIGASCTVVLIIAAVMISGGRANNGLNVATGRSHPTASARLEAKDAVVRSTADIYAAVIRQLVTTDSATATYRVLYVLDGVLPGAGNPYSGVSTDPKHRFDAALKTYLRAELADLPPLTFITHRSTVVAGTPPGQVIHGGVLLTLGPVGPHGAQVEVASNYWVTGLNGRWSTYVLNHTPKGWHVVGTTGPVVIS